MRLFTDRLGFPWIECDPELSVSLFPITKYQFESYLCEPGGLSNCWYGQLLAINPRCSWRSFEDASREQLFMTGVFPSEALQFSHWLGEGYDLPTDTEWKQIDAQIGKVKSSVPIGELIQEIEPSYVAATIAKRLLKTSRIKTLHGLMLLRRGLMEWVRVSDRFGCHGSPRPNFWPVTHNPSIDPPKFTLEPTRRDKQCGFRLVRRNRRTLKES